MRALRVSEVYEVKDNQTTMHQADTYQQTNDPSADKIDLTDQIRLVREAQGGSREAFCSLYGLYKDNLYRYALYRLCDPTQAEDAVSECILAAWRDIGRLRSHAAFGSWIFRILHNICAASIRRDIAARENLGSICYDSWDTISDDPALAVELSEALSRLSDEEQEIVLLSAVSGLTSREISEITGLRPGAVRSKLSRSLSKMREFLS